MGVIKSSKCDVCLHKNVCKNKDEYEAIFKTICDMIDTRKEAEGNYSFQLLCEDYYSSMTGNLR